MHALLRRAMVVGFTAVLAVAGFATLPAHAAPSVTPTACAGVWVVVQSDESTPSSVQVGCATSYSSSLDALQSAGFTPTGTSFVTQVDGLPVDTNYATNGGLWWSHWHTTVTPGGTLGTWSAWTTGADVSVPSQGTVEGWRLTVAGPDGPQLTTLPAASAATTASGPSSSSTSPSSSTTPSGSRSTTTATALAASSVQALSAAGFLAANPPTVDDGAGAAINAALALAATGSCRVDGAVNSLLESVWAQAPDYVGTNPGRAASVAIFAVAMGEDPTAFAGMDLLSILTAGTDSTGQVGTSPSAFTQALAVIAYLRAGQPVPAAVLQSLVDQQDSSGAFGYSYGGTFYTDYDTTGLAIEALYGVGGHASQIASAVAWALSEQDADGHWPNPYSPIDSTGILGAAVQLVGTDTGSALTWLLAQQLPDGGFPASLGAGTSDVLATSDAMWLLTGRTLLTVARVTSCPAAAPSTATAVAAALADTGGPDAGMAALVTATLLVGAGVVLIRSRQARGV